MNFYDVPTNGCNLEIMGYSFFAEEVSPTEAFRRREYNFNSIVGGTKKLTKGEYVGLDFSVVTHVKINPNTPNMYNNIFQEMMSKPVRVVSPDLGGSFNAIVVVKPERDTPRYLKLTISIKEVPDSKSLIPGENFKVPSARKIKVKKVKTSKGKGNTNSKGQSQSKTKTNVVPKKEKGRK